MITADCKDEIDAVIFGDDHGFGLGSDGWECIGPRADSDSPGKDWVRPVEKGRGS